MSDLQALRVEIEQLRGDIETQTALNVVEGATRPNADDLTCGA